MMKKFLITFIGIIIIMGCSSKSEEKKITSQNHVYYLLESYSNMPNNNAIIPGLVEQITQSVQYVDLALSNSDDKIVVDYLKKVINVLEGKDGLNFEENIENKGDDYGVINYINEAIIHTNLALNTENASEEIKIYGEDIIVSLQNTKKSVDESINQAVLAVSQKNLEQRIQYLVRVKKELIYALNGQDSNNDGILDKNETGLLRAKEYTEFLR